MGRIAGVDIPRDKRALIALTYIYGVGPTTSAKILEKAEIPHEVRIKDMTEDQIAKVRSIIEKEFEVEGDMRRSINMNMKRLMDIGWLPGFAPPSRPAGSGSTHPYQCSYPQRARAKL